MRGQELTLGCQGRVSGAAVGAMGRANGEAQYGREAGRRQIGEQWWTG